MAQRELMVDQEGVGKRVDLFLGAALGLSRAKLRALFEEGAVRVEGRRARKGDRVALGQKVSVQIEEAPLLVAEPGAELRVLRADEPLLFLDKPAGKPSHPLRPGETGTVANALVGRFPECAQASEDPREGGLCHRLDTETSGVLLAARTREAWKAMREAFAGRVVDKRYWALVSGPIAEQGEIELPLRHTRKADRVEAAPEGGPGAREALSRFRVLARKGEHALVEMQIITGVMHQVRAHLSAIGAPIVGDLLYGGPPLPELGRVFLHARSLELRHPQRGERVRVESPLPGELAGLLDRLGVVVEESKVEGRTVCAEEQGRQPPLRP